MGGCPGSGTTLVADLLDSIPGMACGPELGFFALREFYERWLSGRHHLPIRGWCAFPHTVYYRPPIPNLAGYGMTLRVFSNLYQLSESLEEFIMLFKTWYSSLRNKTIRLLAEKTPFNVQILPLLNRFESISFLAVIRNPIYVYYNLRRQGFSPLEGYLIWLISNAFIVQYSEQIPHKLKIIKYEEIIASPAHLIERLKDMGYKIDIQPQELLRNLRNNSYRAIHDRVRDLLQYRNPVLLRWSVRCSGKIISANQYVPQLIREEFAWCLTNVCLAPWYAEEIGIGRRCISGTYILQRLGYNVPTYTDVHKPDKLIRFSIRLFLKNVLRSLRWSLTSNHAFTRYLFPFLVKPLQ